MSKPEDKRLLVILGYFSAITCILCFWFCHVCLCCPVSWPSFPSVSDCCIQFTCWL